MITRDDLIWSAGFLEGEGSFGADRRGATCRITAPQLQRWPLDRLQAIWGGSLRLRIMKGRWAERCPNPINVWVLNGVAAAGAMMTLYSFLSPRRREQIRAALSKWKTRKASHLYRHVCPRGHVYDVVTINRITKRKNRRCRQCMSRNNAAAYRRRQIARASTSVQLDLGA